MEKNKQIFACNCSVDLERFYLKQLVDNLPEYLFWKDKHSVFLGCNKSFAFMAGLSSPSEIIGKTDYELPWSKEESDTYRADDLQVIQSGQGKYNIEESQTNNQGEKITLLTNKIPLYDQQGNIAGVVGIYANITELKNTQLKLHKEKTRVEAISKAKSEFIANMSHDLRTPLTGVVGMAKDMLITAEQHRALLESANDPYMSDSTKQLVYEVLDTVQQDSELLTDSADQLIQLCNEILETVSLESGQSTAPIESFNLREVVVDNIQLLLPAATHKKLNLTYHIDNKVPIFLCGIRTYLDRSLLNMISNALKFTKTGFVKITVTLADDDAMTTCKVGDKINVIVTIEDSGIGIPKDKFEAIFEHFSRLHPSYQGIYQGAGLGLFTVKQYVKAMNGTVTVESELGQGSTFILDLPFTVSDHTDRIKKSVLSSKKQKQITETQPIPQTKSPSASLLIVEDNYIAAKALQSYLKKHYGLQSDIAGDGTEAFTSEAPMSCFQKTAA